MDQMNQTESKAQKKDIKKDIRDTLITIVSALILAIVLNTFVFQLIEVSKTSMVPTLQDSEVVFLNKTAYWFGNPKSGDIIVFSRKESGQTVNYVKRVIGVPGDVIEIKGGKVYRNGHTLVEPYLAVTTYGDIYCEIPEGKYFVMGDNRNVSLDSKDNEFGLMLESEVVGKVAFKVRPFGKIEKYVHDYADFQK
ncbi:MAG: signal peptidase I [Clostridiales bacterium]|nr:signal peptidase I [Clostridiales bacterium]